MKDVYHKYGPALFIFILIFIAANIIKPFFITLLTTMIITYLFYPIYVSVRSKIKNENLSAWIMILFILILVIGPITFVISSVVSEIPSVYDAVNDVINSEDLVTNPIFSPENLPFELKSSYHDNFNDVSFSHSEIKIKSDKILEIDNDNNIGNTIPLY